MSEPTVPPPTRIIGRYAIYGEIAAGGMATVHLGRLLGEAGFSRTVAIKRLHPHFAKDPDFVAMFIDEARLASRIRHPNVVSTLDVVAMEGELFLVMEYVQGESLSKLIRSARAEKKQIPPKIAIAIMAGVLHGLHAAHEAKSEAGELLGIVHRDMSPQNILVDTDGVARVIDFGVAKAAGRLQSTRDGLLKGKLQYMAPEQIMGGGVDRRSDIYAASVVLWETLTSKRLFKADNDAALLSLIMSTVQSGTIDPPSKIVSGLPRSLDAIVMKGMAFVADERFPTAREMAISLEKALVLASTREVGEWIEKAAGVGLKEKSERVAEIESISSVSTYRTVSGVEVPGSSGTNPSISGFTPSRNGSNYGTNPSTNPPIEILTSPGIPSKILSSPGFEAPAAAPANNLPLLAAILGGSVIVAAGVIGAVIWLKARPESYVQPATPPQPSAIVAPSASVLPALEPDAAAAVVADATPPQDASDQDSDFSIDPPLPVPTGHRVGPVATGKKPDKVPDKKPAADCDPPYTIDAAGVKRYKPQCLK